MKFSAAAFSALAFAASSSAFAPGQAFARSFSLHSAVADEVYTFEKSEEIFAEAKDVRAHRRELGIVRSGY